MKLAVISDIHGNWPALQAVAAEIDAWQPDRVLVNGDVVNSGPNSRLCWEYIQKRQTINSWLVLRGNHEEYVTEWANPPAHYSGPAYDLVRLSEWTYRQLNGDVAGLAALPARWEWTAPDGNTIVAMHASRLGNRAGIYPFTHDEEARQKIEPAAGVFLTAHTHIPHQRQLDGTLILNTGSVGLPGDGDSRAAWGQLTWRPHRGWQPAIIRTSYDRITAERDFFTTGFMDEAGPETEMSLVEFRMARDIRTRWAAIYRQHILNGSITHAESIRRFLNTPEFKPHTLTATSHGPAHL